MANERNAAPQGPMGGMGGRMQGMGRGGEKANDFSGAIRRLAAYSRRYLPVIAVAVLLAVVGTVCNVIGPDYLARITNLITEGLATGIDLNAVVSVALVLTALYLIGYLLNVIQGVLLADATQSISQNLRGDLSRKINRLPLAYFDRTTVGDTLSRVTNDVDTVGQSLNQSLGSSITAIITLLGTAVMMLWTNWILALAGMLATLIGFWAMIFVIARSQRYFTRQQSVLGQLNGHIEENYTNHNVVKAYNGQRAAGKVFAGLNAALYDSAWKSQFFSGLMQPLMGFVGNLGYVVVCIAGAVLTVMGRADLGTIVAFMSYIRLFSQPLTQIAQAATSLQSAAAAGERVFAFLDEEELPAETPDCRLETARGDVMFRHLSFGYTPERTVLHDFCANIEAGQKVAIVGPTGAGKTTLVNLLMRFYEPTGGKICLDGIPLDHLSRANLRDQFCMVLQDTWLFEGTIRDNIVYCKQEVTDEQVIAACKAVGLHHFIQTLPDGYNTMLKDSTSLSAGQRQLVTIARAMVENAPLLILDEATSSVDTRTEQLIQRAMDCLMKGRTSFIIAHRLSTIRNADLILVLKDGDIIERGTHDQLIAQNGFYAELFNSQFEQVS